VVVGCGSIGRRHARNLKAAGVVDVYLADPDLGAVEATAAESGGQTVRSLDEALDRGARVAFICTPSDSHVQYALRAASAGVDLFIEKPLSHTLDDVPALVDLAERRNLVTMVACNMRFHPGPRTVKQLLADGEVGTAIAARIHTGSYLPRWRPSQDYRRSYSAAVDHGGAILDCIHEIDLALWYFGNGRLHSAAALTASAIGLETDGLAELLIQHASGILSSVHLNFLQRDYARSCVVIGSAGTIEWSFRDREVRVFGEDGTLSRSIAQPAGWQMNDMYVDELSHFLEAVETRTPTMNPVQTARSALTIALDARTRSREVWA
jgi:predicted dehydrogenase